MWYSFFCFVYLLAHFVISSKDIDTSHISVLRTQAVCNKNSTKERKEKWTRYTFLLLYRVLVAVHLILLQDIGEHLLCYNLLLPQSCDTFLTCSQVGSVVGYYLQLCHMVCLLQLIHLKNICMLIIQKCLIYIREVFLSIINIYTILFLHIKKLILNNLI